MKKKSAHNFKFIKLLGEGSFSSVYLAVDANVTSASLIKNQDTSLTSSDQQILLQQQQQNESGIEIESDSSEVSASPKNATINADDNLSTIKSINSLNNKQNIIKKIPKYAIKVCQKSYIKRQGKQEAIMREKEIMNILNQQPNKYFLKLHYTFQDINRLYFVMTYAENGDLLNYMQKKLLSIKLVKKYTKQLVSALEHLHKLGIVHRDLKPENILLNSDFDIFITDFGSAQIYNLDYTKPKDLNYKQSTTTTSKSPDRRNSFVGTAQYVSPEMLKNREASNKSDLWALGVILYQMVTNIMPFNAPNEYLIYQKIQNLDYKFTEDFDLNAKDLVTSLIKLEPSERLGANDDLQNHGYLSISRHKFIHNYNNEVECEDGLLGTDKEYEKGNQINNDGDLEYLTRTNSHRLQEQQQQKTLTNHYKHDQTNFEHDIVDPDLIGIDKINPGLDEAQLLRLLTVG